MISALYTSAFACAVDTTQEEWLLLTAFLSQFPAASDVWMGKSFNASLH
jgi:hypothetical protein